MKLFTAAATASVVSLVSSTKYGHCPEPTSIQSDYVKEHFDIRKMEGTFYELAYHDYTQPPKVCDCQRSVKVYTCTLLLKMAGFMMMIVVNHVHYTSIIYLLLLL